MLQNPYEGVPRSGWPAITRELVDAHPLKPDAVVDHVSDAWDRIMDSRIGGHLRMGEDFRPSPQLMGSFLHAVFAAVVEEKNPGVWRAEATKEDKDLVYIKDDSFSTEVKTSSSARSIYGNRSYAQPQSERGSGKSKDGYYIAINTQAFSRTRAPRVRRIAMGWLSHEDWIPQASVTGQRAHLEQETYRDKFIVLYP